MESHAISQTNKQTTKSSSMEVMNALKAREGGSVDEQGASSEEGFPTPKWDLSGLVGKHVKYTYSNGWQYEIYYKNWDTMDYRVVSGLVGGRLVKGQKVHMRHLGEKRYMVSWTEPTGTSVSKVVDLENREVNSVIFFPCWVKNDPAKTICFQNDHLNLMLSFRDTGPTYPLHIVHGYGHMHFIEDCDTNNDHVIS